MQKSIVSVDIALVGKPGFNKYFTNYESGLLGGKVIVKGASS